VDFGLWGEGAVFGICGEFVDLFGLVFVFLHGLFGEVQAGDLEGVEEQACSA
jgi:hypothetical protein